MPTFERVQTSAFIALTVVSALGSIKLAMELTARAVLFVDARRTRKQIIALYEQRDRDAQVMNDITARTTEAMRTKREEALKVFEEWWQETGEAIAEHFLSDPLNAILPNSNEELNLQDIRNTVAQFAVYHAVTSVAGDGHVASENYLIERGFSPEEAEEVVQQGLSLAPPSSIDIDTLRMLIIRFGYDADELEARFAALA